jgi:hypothetical protein
MTQTHLPHRRVPGMLKARASGTDFGGALTRGAIVGVVAGRAFLLANMWFAYSQGLPAAPLAVIATVFSAASAHLDSVQHAGGPGPPHRAVPGVRHGLALLLLISPPLRRPAVLVLAGIGYGLALWILDFQILGRTVFPSLTDPMGPNQLFEALIHPLIFGLGLVPFFLGWTPRPARQTLADLPAHSSPERS